MFEFLMLFLESGREYGVDDPLVPYEWGDFQME